ncbi:MAG: 4Fe-4S cluster-binding domain-containing protein, partial [Haliea sp.]
MTETVLQLSRVHFPVTALGPGRRIGIWFQGCSIRCSGCISLDTWDDKKGLTSVENFMAEVYEWVAKADGVTISGGEPFDQVHALERLLVEFRA